jgi:hypothetical protein
MMNKQDWQRSKNRLRKMVREGVQDMKEWAAEASYLTDATSQVVKLELDIHKTYSKKEKNAFELGKEVAKAASATGALKSNAKIKKLIQDIKAAEKKIQEFEKTVKGIDISWKAAKSVVTTRKAPTKKKASTKKKKAVKKKP